MPPALPSLYCGPIAIFHVAFHSESLGSETNLCVGAQQCLRLTGVTRDLTILFPKCFLILEMTAGYLVNVNSIGMEAFKSSFRL